MSAAHALRRAARRRLARARRGMTLVEVMMTVSVLLIGVLSVAKTTSAVIRQRSNTEAMLIASTLAQSRLERMKGMNCGQLSAGSDATTYRANSITETWTFQRRTVDDMDVAVLQDSISYKVRRGNTLQTRSMVFRSFRQCT